MSDTTIPTPAIDDGRAPARRVAALILQALGVIDVVTDSGSDPKEGFIFRDDITLDAIGGALELVRAARATLDQVNANGRGADFPAAEPERLMLRPMLGTTDRFPVDPIDHALTRAEGVLEVLVASSPTGLIVPRHQAVMNALWAVTGILAGATVVLARVDYLDIPRVPTVEAA